MITSFIIKKTIIPIIEKIFFKMFDQQALVWKFRENNNYRELPNEADLNAEKAIKRGEKQQVEIEMLKDQVKDLLDQVNKLKNILDKLKKVRSL
tara:strand:+ start:404 stop:685 length:282 start_codon:yes stop_codon:yes gene_type:complete